MSSLKMGGMYVLNVVAGLIGLQMVNVPMFFCIRRLVSPTILFYEYFASGKVADFDIRVRFVFQLTRYFTFRQLYFILYRLPLDSLW